MCNSGDEGFPLPDSPSRVKFLCSFGGNILPRPLDGMLRYVGGETRIVTVPCSISYEGFLVRMRDIFEGASVIKYQQPEEELDALVSVVNDDDLMSMMEEYEKLGLTGDGFTRLRIFLFSQPLEAEADIDAACFSVDEREAERRYLDALNSLTDVESESQPMDFVDRILSQRYGEVDGSWSPAYFSPGRDGAAQAFKRGQIERKSAPVIEKSCFASHLGCRQNACEGNGISENCHMAFKRGQTLMSNSCFPDSCFKHGEHHLDRCYACGECYHCREPYVLKQGRKLEHGGVLVKEAQKHDNSCIIHPHHSNLRMDDRRDELPKPGRVREHNVFDVNAVDSPYGHENLDEGNEVFQAQQTDRASPHAHIDGFEDNGVCYGSHPSDYVEEIFHQFQHNLPPRHLRGTSYVSPGLMGPNGSMSSGPEHSYEDRSQGIALNAKTNRPWAARNAASAYHSEHGLSENINAFPANVSSENANPARKEILAKLAEENLETTNVCDSDAKAAVENGDIRVENLEFSPELIATVKKATLLEAVEEVKAVADRDAADVLTTENDEKPSSNELEQGYVHAKGEVESDGDGESKSFQTIEPTTAESEASANELQTIQNDDLEEIKELGSGTYGAVYHSKWRGSDVAVKRIKASCFAGNPSERERLIADFWKEASILSSLHHPNVVSFYGVVHDGPDGCLATVTEFMVNGSLKQFLQKKDRTIDRRKRLIIAMDVAFGMEYLHGKNIVHFDLKCENLLVNMRDPHRPVCKIGDLGLSKVKQNTLVSGGVRGTLPWMAPELLSGKTSMVSEKIDVYSFGIVMWELLTGEEPYSDRHFTSIIGGIMNSTLRPHIPSWCDPEWKSLMESCWSSDPPQRPSFSVISQSLRKMAAAVNVK